MAPAPEGDVYVRPDMPRILILLGGMPGAGKSTIARELAKQLPQEARLIVSADFRKRLRLQNPFDAGSRVALQAALSEALRMHAKEGARFIILDSNLLEKAARQLMAHSVQPSYRSVFIGPHAERDVLEPRVADKFGSEYMYPPGQFSGGSVIDHSLAVGEPVTAQEAVSTYEAVWTVDTGRGRVGRWGAVENHQELRDIERAILATQERSSSFHPVRALKLLSEDDKWMWDPETDGLIARSPERPVTYHRRRSVLQVPELARVTPESLVDYSRSYLGSLRRLYGPGQLIVPSVRVVIRRGQDVLLVKRRDSGSWSVVGGSQELDESIHDTALRETAEETGLLPGDLQLVAIESGRQHVAIDAFGNCNQALVFTFLCTRVSGTALESSLETDAVRWFAIDDLPDLPERHRASIQSALEYTGRVKET